MKPNPGNYIFSGIKYVILSTSLACLLLLNSTLTSYAGQTLDSETTETQNISVDEKKPEMTDAKPTSVNETDSAENKQTSTNETDLTEAEPASINETDLTETEPASINETVLAEAVTSANPLTVPLSQVIQNTRSYILKTDKNPDWQSQWFVLGNARNSRTFSDSYYKTFYRNAVRYIKEKDGMLSPTQYSEYSKSILTFTSIGCDARDIAGYDLLSCLSDFTKVKKQGFNGPVWTLIALHANPVYEIPLNPDVTEQTTEETILDYILGRELTDGGFTFSGDQADIDMTAITLQALAPYYHKPGYERVTDAIDRALIFLSENQTEETGGFMSMSTENAESCAQVIVALCALGIDCASDSRFIKNGKWPVEALISYQLEDGSFMHIQDGRKNSLATAQAFYALTAYQRFKNNQTFLYDMSDLTLVPGPDIEEDAANEESPAETDKQPDHITNTETDNRHENASDAESNRQPENTSDAESAKDSVSETKKDISSEVTKDSESETIKGSASETKKDLENRKESEHTKGSENGSPQKTLSANRPSKGGGSLSIVKSTSASETSPETESGDLSETETTAAAETGWFFSGEDYIPEAAEEEIFTAGDMNAASSNVSLKQSTAAAQSASTTALTAGLILGFLAFAVCLYYYFTGKKKRG